MAVLVTGVAGFIGFHLSKRLLLEGFDVIGVDNVNSYYDKNLKLARLRHLDELKHDGSYAFLQKDLADASTVDQLAELDDINLIVHLAAQPGVRYSLENPRAYVDSNVYGFTSILELARQLKPDHLVYASSSSVYGGNRKIPFHEEDRVDHPVSFYAVTKKANELMAHSYSHLYGIPTTGLRFFTVYGPWGRPDMAPMIFTKAIFEGQPIRVFNQGNMGRDFTYIDDIIDGVVRILHMPPASEGSVDEASDAGEGAVAAPYRILNIGNNNPVRLMDFIQTLESVIGKKAILQMDAMQPGDVKETYADISNISKLCGFKPSTGLSAGLAELVDWYREYFRE